MAGAGIETLEEKKSLSPFRHFTAADWGRLRQDTPLPLSEKELEELKVIRRVDECSLCMAPSTTSHSWRVRRRS